MHCWARYLFLALVAALATGQMLAACGQKGDLYLVKDGAPASKEQPTRQVRSKPVVEPDYAPQGDGESLDVYDAVPSATPDPSGI
jgi:predicted small lipoprotein YifL